MRLRSLLDAPAAFGQTHEAAAAMPEDEWMSIAKTSAVGDRRTWFMARDENEAVVGVVQARRRPPDECLLFSMWVAPEARKLGVGASLVNAVDDWGATWGAHRVILWVIGTNEGAFRFYERIGFRILETGPDAESGAAYGAFAMERPRQKVQFVTA
ncbi:MAG: GNAT family N-acetyltransferase [Candidatus Limnocylindrales bacterium]